MITQSAVSGPTAVLANQGSSSDQCPACVQSSTSGRWRRILRHTRRVSALLSAIVLAAIVCAAAQAQTLLPSWTQQSPVNSPGPKFTHGMAYDSAHGVVVVFGGFASNDTWLWNGTNWTLASPANRPSARSNAYITYDAAHGQVVLFGGADGGGNRLGDTWLWDGTNWTQASPATNPPARNGHTMSYDSVHGQVLLFGGVSVSGSVLGDTWVWDGTNWTAQSTTASPSARFNHSTVFDAAHGQVMLFGGTQGGGTYLNDTWTWSGTNWVQQAPATSPAVRYAASMAYDAALGQVVLFGGYNGTYFNDTWLWNGANWTQYSPANSPSARYFPNDMAYDSIRNQVLMFGGSNGGTALGDTWEFGQPGNFGNVNVCPAGNTTPTPCSSTVSFTYNFASTANLNAPQVLTQGAAGLDFTLASGSTCTGAVPAGTCTVNVTFTPTAPGLRTGAIQLLDSTTGNILVSSPISGTGQGPAVAFSPEPASPLATNFDLAIGIATDSSGNVFASDYNTGLVTKISPGGAQSPVGGSFSLPQGLAVDGAGNVYVAEHGVGRITMVPPGCASSTCQVSLNAAIGLAQPTGVAVDSVGNLFISSLVPAQVTEIPAGCTVAGCTRIIWTGPTGSQPTGVSVDAVGNLFITDGGTPHNVIEIPAGCSNTTCQLSIGSGWLAPTDAVADAAGNIFVSDVNIGVVEVPAGCTQGSCRIQLYNGAGPYDLALDGKGNLFFSAFDKVIAINRSFASSLTFAPTVTGNTSTDSPQSINLQNIGNQPLNAVSPGLVTIAGPNFVSTSGQGTPADCSTFSTLPPGALCNQSISFTPQTTGDPLTSQILFSNNALNAAAATQAVNLTGTGIAPAPNVTAYLFLNGAGTGIVTDNAGQLNCSEANNGSTFGTCAGFYPSGQRVTLTAQATGSSTFTGWGGICASAGTNSSCTVTPTNDDVIYATFVNQNFGSFNVCPAGQPVAGPCSNSAPITFAVPVATTIGAIRVVTQGAPGLDFSQGSGSTCAGTVAGGSSCTVSVNFAPTAPGLRMGAVQMFDNNGVLIASSPVYGVGQESEIAFGPGVQTALPLAGLHYNVGVAVDATGNTFVADYTAGRVVKYSPSGVQTTVPATGLSAPIGVAVDGAGALYIVDLNLPYAVKLSPDGVRTTLGNGLNNPIGVALDGAGNVYIGDRGSNRVVKITPSGVQSTVPTTGLNQPWGIAVDAQSNLFIADGGNSRVVKVTSGGVQTIVPATGLSQPYGIAVDAAGDVYIADPVNARVVLIPASGGPQTTVGSGLNYPSGVTVDASGNVLIGDQGAGQVYKVNRSQAPAITFATTNVGSTSADSPVTVTVQNIGNQPLTGSLALNLGGNFTQSVNPGCSGFALAPSASCTESFSFTPQSATFASGTAVFTDNSLNIIPATQTITLSGTGATNGVQGTVAVPNVIGQAQAAAATPITGAGLALGAVTTAASNTVPSGSVISQSPDAGTQVAVGSAVNLLVSSGIAQAPSPNPLLLENNYFVTGDYVSAGVTLRGLGVGGVATRSITIPSYSQSPSQGVPAGADIVDAFLYWETLENTPTASSASGKFNGYPIVGQQIGIDQPSYVDGQFTGTIRVYRASVNAYLPVGANGIRIVSGSYSVSLPDGGTALPLTEGASLVMVYRVLSPNFPLKSVVIYDGSAVPSVTATQVVQGFYDAVGGANGTGKNTNLFASGGVWNNAVNSVALGASNKFNATLNPLAAYAAVILSTPVRNSDNDGILDAWKAGPAAGDFHAGQPGYYDVKTGSWVGLPGAKPGQKDLFVQLDYMCGAVFTDGSCDTTQENLFPGPDAKGNDPLAMVKQAFANSGVQLHLQIGNAVPEGTCVDDLTTTPATLCQFPNQPGVIGWKNSLQFSKLWPRNLAGCLSGGDCTTRFPYGQKDSYHYVLFGHSLAIPAWNTRYGTLTSINVANGFTTIVTADRGNGINACPARITLAGVLGNPPLNGVYNTTGCADTKTIRFATPGVPNWSYPNATLPEPVIGLTSGTISSISGYSDLGGSDSAVTLGLWLTAPNQDMSKKANVVAGTLFHEIGHTLGLSHGGLYYDTPGSYVPTFEGNCKPNYQSVMNYLFQLDLVGPNQAIALSNQTLNTLNESTAGSVTQLTDILNNPATFPTSAWYVPYTTGSAATPATRHCDGTPLNGDSAYRVDASVAPITPPWTNGQDLNFIGKLQTQERGFNDLANLDLRQIGATGGDFASLASVFSFGSAVTPLNISAGGTVALGSGGTVALGSGGTVALGSGGNVTLSSGGTIALGSGGTVALGSGGVVTIGASGGTVSPGSSGTVALGSGGTVTLSSGGTIALGSGGTVALGSGGTVALGSGGTIALGSGGTVTIPASGGSYTLNSSGGTIALGSGGTVALGSGGTVTLSGAGTIALGSGGTIALGSGGTVALGSGGTIALGSGGTVALGSGGNVTLSSGGTIALGSGGTVALGSGGTVALGSGGTVTLGSSGNVALGSGGTVALGSGGTATLGAGGSVTLGAGGTVALGSGGTVALGSGGTIALGSGGTVALGSGGTVTLAFGGTIALGSGGSVTIAAGGTYTINSAGGTIALGSGGTVALGSGGTVTLSAAGTIALGSGGTIALGSGGKVTLINGGVLNLGPGGSVSLANGTGSTQTLSTVSNITPASAGPTATDELTYETANSIVRPPSLPTETVTPAGVRITWKAPAFGVVQTYTIYRSSNGATPIVIGSVSGVDGNPPATEFTDTNPDRASQTVVYTVSTILVPDSTGAPARQSPPSPPAVLKNDQSITLGPLPSSVLVNNPPTVTATATSSGVPNGLQVVFSATGSCTIGTQSIINNVSSASVILNGPGSCTVTAAQPGSTGFNAANSVSGTFLVLPLGSGTQSQTITFPTLPNAQYGGSFVPTASSSSALPVSFATSGPCTATGVITGVGVCSITASAPANSTYSAASVTQSFTIYPAVLKVIANNLSVVSGQPLPALTYAYNGFVNGDPVSVVRGMPSLSTTATTTSGAGAYPIAVSTGTLASANYSFLYVSGILTVQPASQTITFTKNPPASAIYGSTFTVAATGGASGNAVIFTSAGACSNLGAVYTMTNSTGTCSVIANQAGNAKYTAAPTVTKTVTAIGPLLNVSTSSIDFGTLYLGGVKLQTITLTNIGTAPVIITDPILSIVKGGNSNEFIALNLCPKPLAVGKSCNVTIAFLAGPFYTPQTATLQIMSNAPGSPQPVALSALVINPKATLSSSSLNFGTVKRATSSTQSVTLTNTGNTPLALTGINVNGANAASFTQSNTCGNSLAAGARCTIAVRFAPTTSANNIASLTIVDNAQAGNGTQTVSLVGKGN